MRALLVEDDNGIATVVESALVGEGFTVTACDSVAARDRALADGSFDVMVTDIMLGDGDGIGTLGAVRERHPDLPVIVMSAQNTLDTAVRASETNAFEYFPKPFDIDELTRAARLAATASGRTEAATGPVQELPLIGRSAAMQDVYRLITRLLDNDLTVLVTGESGTGKELVAEAIHELGHRRTGPFVALNMAAIPAELIESELFGHEKGAFTGAVARQLGKFEQASGGTLFLDEIGDMPMKAQTRLLRALQSGRIRRVGGAQEISVDVRIIAATNRDLAPMIGAGTFREDLFYRLNVLPIVLPPLRERREDIPELARHFLAQAPDEGLPVRRLSPDGAKLLSAHDWPGNVRELRNTMLRAALLAREEEIEVATLRPIVGAPKAGGTAGTGEASFAAAIGAWLEREGPPEGALYHRALAAFEVPLFEHALRSTNGNQLQAAKLLGINRNTLRKRIVDLGIDADRFA
ncbi:sigma-54 dependent transcriptional regulator [Alteriqipengyuania flavescens]|uniref:sigma 54-interacting transcriptional regulator n=1 Tax=Alteriqipengyuania flavescens TaxID=3053610 RepID=UPI0025B50320|nr:sigma-54 dependent transcriptional regulator [Alteriqipengyuania flavescens]WJY18201.1 sigma-54 dependent transcriptional regulator [Alteriqipengyuania flavescens]WJY24142.1 sigma-54 dependent transcriptional regulator [Alteriqipengyuania flavescens]